MSNNEHNNNLVRIIPNVLTLGRLILTLIFLGMILYAPQMGREKPAGFLLTAFILFVVAGITDIVDGKIARMYDVTSKFGRMIDPLADKALICGAFICFAIVGEPKLANFNLSVLTLSFIHWLVALVLIARELLVTILRHLAEARGVNFAATVSGKIKMFIQSFGIGTVIIGWAYVSRTWGDWFTIITLVIMITVTVISGINSLKRPRA